MTQPSPPPRVRALRSAQALFGILVAAGGAAGFDWRAGLLVLGAGLFATSAIWRETA